MIVDDLLRTTRGTKFTRATQPRKPFAICICRCKRDELSREMLYQQRLTDWRGHEIRATTLPTLMVNGALIGTIACN